MPDRTVRSHPLSLPEELILMLLNEQNGYFHQVPGWDLNCTVVGAVLAELSLQSRIDTDLDSLHLLDPTETGDPALDPILNQIADELDQRNTRYWIERLAGQSDSIIDLILDRLVEMKILEHHDGDFWTLATAKWYEDLRDAPRKGRSASSSRRASSRRSSPTRFPIRETPSSSASPTRATSFASCSSSTRRRKSASPLSARWI